MLLYESHLRSVSLLLHARQTSNLPFNQIKRFQGPMSRKQLRSIENCIAVAAGTLCCCLQ